MSIARIYSIQGETKSTNLESCLLYAEKCCVQLLYCFSVYSKLRFAPHSVAFRTVITNVNLLRVSGMSTAKADSLPVLAGKLL